MAAILQTILLYESYFIYSKISLRFVHKALIDIIGSVNGLAPNRRQAIIWINDGLVYWCIYSPFGLNELTSTKMWL